ncbi:MAG TPA: glycine cleavage system protein GcvH [Legionellaceae bacterium]|nr:glycine cleavage system protein GcvH [Legionellaceae bacterium]
MKHLRFTSTHEWVDTENDIMRIGITQHAQSLLGDMVYIELSTVGTEVQAGDEIGVLESVKAASEIYAPISGVIVEINQAAIDEPALLNKDPYGAGWLMTIQPHTNEKALEEMNQLYKEEAYLEEIAEEH